MTCVVSDAPHLATPSSLAEAEAVDGAASEPVPDVLADRPLVSLIEEGVQKQLCQGKLLLRIRLACDEIASLTEPAPFFRLLPRLAYLPCIFNEVYDNFKSCLPPLLGQTYEIWFEYNGIPLRWHFPVGVLCDVLVGDADIVPVPLDVTVHFRGCPTKELLPFSGIGDLKSAVMSSFQQAVFLQQGSTQAWSRMPMQQQQRLWDAIKATDLEGSSEVRRHLLCQSLSKCKSLSVRIHIWAETHTVLLHPSPPLDGDGQPITLARFLQETLPPLFVKSADHEAAAWELADGVSVLVHGLRLPMETPMYWLALHTSCLDNFVHLTVRMPQNERSPSAAGSASGV